MDYSNGSYNTLTSSFRGFILIQRAERNPFSKEAESQVKYKLRGVRPYISVSGLLMLPLCAQEEYYEIRSQEKHRQSFS